MLNIITCSVSWGIEDLIVEYAQQIELHTNTLLTKIQVYKDRYKNRLNSLHEILCPYL